MALFRRHIESLYCAFSDVIPFSYRNGKECVTGKGNGVSGLFRHPVDLEFFRFLVKSVGVVFHVRGCVNKVKKVNLG